VNLLDRGVGLVRRLLESTRDLLGRLLGRCRGLLRHLLESARGLLRGLLGRGGGLLGDRRGILGGRRSRLACRLRFLGRRLRFLGRRLRFLGSDNGLTDLLVKRSHSASKLFDLGGHVIDPTTRFGDAVAYLFGSTLGQARFRGQFIQLRAKVRLGLKESLDVLLPFLRRPLLPRLEIGIHPRQLALEV
jgi:hypothetical protein